MCTVRMRGAYRQRPVGADQQRVAVGCRARDRFGGDIAAGARAILHHHRLPKRLRKRLGDRARHDVRLPSGREWNDQPDRARWVPFGRGDRRYQEHGRQEARAAHAQ